MVSSMVGTFCDRGPRTPDVGGLKAEAVPEIADLACFETRAVGPLLSMTNLGSREERGR
jgi:hypothetical protein